MDFDEAVSTFVCERREAALKKMRSDNEDYISNNKRLIELSEKVAEYLRYMDADEKEIFVAYNDCKNAQEGDNMDQAYLCGMKDAFQLMKLLAEV